MGEAMNVYPSVGLACLVMVLATAACGPGSATNSGLWAEPTLAPVPHHYEFQTPRFQDIGDAAEASGAIVIGHFEGEPTRTTVADMYPSDPAVIEELDGSGGIEVDIWTFSIDHNVKGGLAHQGDILVAVFLTERDVQGVAEDPGRLEGQRAVLLLEGIAHWSEPEHVHYPISQRQLGVNFALLRDDGTVVVDPQARVGLPRGLAHSPLSDDHTDEQLINAIRRQLGIA